MVVKAYFRPNMGVIGYRRSQHSGTNVVRNYGIGLRCFTHAEFRHLDVGVEGRRLDKLTRSRDNGFGFPQFLLARLERLCRSGRRESKG